MSELYSEGASASPLSSVSQADPSIAAKCRAKRMGGITSFAECLVKPAPHCPFGFAYGYGHFCRHPERERIISRTQATGCAG